VVEPGRELVHRTATHPLAAYVNSHERPGFVLEEHLGPLPESTE